MQNAQYSHITGTSLDSEWFDKLYYIYQHFQESEKTHQIDPQHDIPISDESSLYPHINNDIEYRLDSQIKDDFQCNQDCYSQHNQTNADQPPMACMHTYEHITEQIHDLSDSTQQHTLHSIEQDASLFKTDSTNPCHFNITHQDFDTNSDTVHNTPN